MMKKGILITCLIAALISHFILFLASAAVVEGDTGGYSTGDRVNVIVVLDNSSQSGGVIARMFSSSSSKVNAETLKGEYNVSYIADSLNSVSMTVKKEDIADIANMAGVKSVREALDLRLSLQDSVPLVNASSSKEFQAGGINLTGQGQTICIIDSGINYTHEAFGACTREDILAGNCSKIIGGYAYYNNVSSDKRDIMGDSDHGTHVAGIAAGAEGVAPDAKIVAIKACGPGDGCDEAAVLQGLDWCVNNATIFNITVISMSLGTAAPQLFNTACDSLSPNFRTRLSAAAAKNISVIVASGNDANATHISLPACMSNATAVGWTNKDDTLASNGNRGLLVQLLAPGSNINSSLLGGTYGLLSGTSMATPHVSGAVAVIRQLTDFLSLKKTPSQVENILNGTGKMITDSTNITYSRIDLQTALLSLDTINPRLETDGIGSGDETTNTSITFSANATDWLLSNMTFILVNSSGQTVNEMAWNLSGAFANASITINNLANGTYNWTFVAVDSRSNSNSSGSTFYAGIRSIVLNYPAQDYSVTSSLASVEFNFSLNSNINITNCTLIVNGTELSTINISENTGNYSINNSLLPGNYSWKIRCAYNDTNITSDEIRSLMVNAPIQQQSSPGEVVSRSGGSSGGGGSAAIYSATAQQIEEGYTRMLRKYESVLFSLPSDASVEHKLTLDAIYNEYANFTVRSEPVKFTLGRGDSIKLNITSQDKYDLMVSLDDVNKSGAIVKIMEIAEPVAAASINALNEGWNLSLKDSDNVNRGISENMNIDSTWYYPLAISAILIILYIVYRRTH